MGLPLEENSARFLEARQKLADGFLEARFLEARFLEARQKADPCFLELKNEKGRSLYKVRNVIFSL